MTRSVLPVRSLMPAGVDPCPTEFVIGGGEGNADWMMLDFGRELSGRLRFEVDRKCRVRVNLGESFGEAYHGGFATELFEPDEPGELLTRPSGFRFAQIELGPRGENGRLSIRSPRAELDDLERERVGSFLCNDDRLNRIWEVGAETVRLCSPSLIWDGVKRGRTVWAGDLHVAADAGFAAFGPNFGAAVESSLAWLANRNRSSSGAYHWINGIGPYTAWWLIVAESWAERTGDLGFVERLAPHIEGISLDLLESIDETGHERLGGWRFLDWGTRYDGHAEDSGIQGIAAWGVQSAERLARRLGRDQTAKVAKETRERMCAPEPLPPAPCKLVWAALVAGGLVDASTANARSLSIAPTSGLSPFLGSLVLEARAAAGDHAGAIDVIRRYWGGMLDLGASTWWEDFDLAWIDQGLGPIDTPDLPAGRRDLSTFGRSASSGFDMSLCHAWSSGPTAWMSRHVLGVTVDGGGSIRVDPHLGDLDWAEGVVPTRIGPVRVRHARTADGRVETGIEAP